MKAITVLLLFATSIAFGQGGTRLSSRVRLVHRYGRIPLAFEPNVGQVNRGVRFFAHGGGYGVYVAPDQTVITLHQNDPEYLGTAPDVIRMRLVGAVRSSAMSAEERLPGRSNYLIGRNSSQWQTGIPTFRKIVQRGVYPGIDMVYHGEQRHLEYDFVVSPHADPESIQLAFDGAEQKIDAHGELVLSLADGKKLRFRRPLIYQQAGGGNKKMISGKFVQRKTSQFGFAIGPYDRGRALIIDPVLSYSTFLGGSDTDAATRIAVDSSGNAYVVGYTASSNFPTKDAFQSINNAPSACQFDLMCFSGTNVFVSKLNASGTALLYSTFLGGKMGVQGNPVTDVGVGIAVDSTGHAYVTGSASSTDFPTTTGAFQTSYPGGTGAGSPFVTKLSPSGAVLVYSTYLGGSTGPPDSGIGITLDSLGNAYIAGYTFSSRFPTTTGAYKRTCTPLAGQATCSGDVFVSKLNPTGSALVYSTYIGGSNVDAPSAIAIDSSDNAYITGGTFSADYPTSAGALQRTFAGPSRGTGFCGNISALIPCGDAFITKLNSAGSQLLYSTYLGGKDEELGMDLKVDGSGSAYVTGFTRSTNFPVTTGAFQTVSQGDATFELGDAFVSKINSTGTALVYSTYLGGDGFDVGWGIALDKNNNAYVSGVTESDNFPLKSPLQVMNSLVDKESFAAAQNQAETAFVTELNATGSALNFSTVLGGRAELFDAIASGIALDSKGAIYITGVDSGDLPTTPGVFDPNCHMTSGICDYDAFVAKIAFSTAPAMLFTPRIIDFGYVGVGKTSPAVPFKITNQGNATLNISSIKVTTPTDFVITNNTCGAAPTLAPGASCGMNFALHPTKTNTNYFTNIFISENEFISPQGLLMRGIGDDTLITPSFLNFNFQKVGTTSSPQTISITNLLTKSLTMKFVLGNSTDYGISSNPCATILAGKTCSIGVVFKPKVTGRINSSITINDSGGGTWTVQLFGSGN